MAINVSMLGGRGAILGVLEDDELDLSEERLGLSVGDRLVLYTDGLTDVINPDGEFFDIHRLQGLLRYRADAPLSEMCAMICAELYRYQGAAEQFDDMTLLIVEVK